MAGMREKFVLIYWLLHLVVKQSDSERTFKFNRQFFPVKGQARSRIKRNDDIIRNVAGCLKNKDKVLDKLNGFPQLPMKDYNVSLMNNNGNYSVKITWKPPTGKPNNRLVGYWFTLLVLCADGRPKSLVCTELSAEDTSFVIHESALWTKKDEVILISIKPLPSLFPGFTPGNSTFAEITLEEESNVASSTASTVTRSSATVPSSSSTDVNSLPTERKKKIEMRASAKKKSKENLVFAIAIPTVAIAVLLFGLLIILLRWKRSQDDKHQTQKVVEIPTNPGYVFVSYIAESERHTQKVVNFSSWFIEQGYDVQMEGMLPPDKQKERMELGRLRWAANQVLNAKNVFIIISPSYLNLCRLDESETDGSTLSQEETMVFSEITQIRNELSSNAYISSKFIPVLFEVKETELPFWIKQFNVYNWPDDKTKLLYRIYEEVTQDNEVKEESA